MKTFRVWKHTDFFPSNQIKKKTSTQEERLLKNKKMSELNLYPKKGIYKKSVKIMLNVSDKKICTKKRHQCWKYLFSTNSMWCGPLNLGLQYFNTFDWKYQSIAKPNIPENIFCDCVCVCLYFVSIVYWQNITNYTKKLYTDERNNNYTRIYVLCQIMKKFWNI